MDLTKLRRGMARAWARKQAAKQAAAALVPPPVDTVMWAAGDVVQRKSARSSEGLGMVVAVTPSPPGMPPTLHVQFGYVVQTVAEGLSHTGTLVHAMEQRMRCVAVYADEVYKVHLRLGVPLPKSASVASPGTLSHAGTRSPSGATKSAMKAKLRWPRKPPAAKPKAKPKAKPAAEPVAKPVAKPAAKPAAEPVAVPAKKKRKRRAGMLAKLGTEGSRWQRQMMETGHRMRVKKQARHENYASHDKYAFKTVTLTDMIGSNRAIDEDIRANTV
jgi:hypothetical protein